MDIKQQDHEMSGILAIPATNGMPQTEAEESLTPICIKESSLIVDEATHGRVVLGFLDRGTDLQISGHSNHTLDDFTLEEERRNKKEERRKKKEERRMIVNEQTNKQMNDW